MNAPIKAVEDKMKTLQDDLKWLSDDYFGLGRTAIQCYDQTRSAILELIKKDLTVQISQLRSYLAEWAPLESD